MLKFGVRVFAEYKYIEYQRSQTPRIRLPLIAHDIDLDLSHLNSKHFSSYTTFPNAGIRV